MTGGGSQSGGLGNDIMTFPAGTGRGTLMTGEGGNDTLTNNNTAGGNFSGGAGNDTITAGSGSDTLFGDAGNDTLNGGLGVNSILGGPGDDTLTGGLSNDTVSGDDGDDTYRASIVLDGRDFFFGGTGSDTADYQARNNAGRNTLLTLTLNGTGDDGEPNEGDTFAADVENVKGGTGRNFITGNTLDNTLEGNVQPDIILAQDGIGGNDVIDSHPFGGDVCTADPGDSVIC